MNTEPAVQFDNVSLTLDENFEILRGLNLVIPPKSITSLLGPSGCGKTIMLYLLAGFLKPTSGTISSFGSPIAVPSSERMMVFQNYALFHWKNVEQNIRAALLTSSISEHARAERVSEALRLVGLGEFADWPIYKLSGGMQQRVALARALVTQPKILLLDEPFAALDHVNRERLRELLTELQQKTGITLLLVSHQITDAMLFSHQVIVFTKRPAQIKHIYDTAGLDGTDIVKLAQIKQSIREDLDAEFIANDNHITFDALLSEV